MKIIRRRVAPAALLLFVAFAIGFALAGHGQSENQTITDQTLQPVASGNIPNSGTFFRLSDYLANDGRLGPPWPFLMDTNASVYSLNGASFLVDDASITNDNDLATALSLLVQPQDQFSSSLMSSDFSSFASSMLTPGDGAGGSVSFPTNGLWIEVPTNSLAVASHFSVTLHSTVSGQPYDVLTTSNLALPLIDWTVEESLLGATGDFTPAQLAMSGRSNLFVSARFAGSSDDSGIPDWWQLKYFGQTGIDPNADPDNDGWSNVQEFENGTDPNSFNTPPPPHILSATLDSSGNIHLTWAPGGGPVTQYAVENLNDSTNVVSENTRDGTVPADFEFGVSEFGEPTLQVEAVYSGGLRVPSQEVRVGNYGPNLNVQFFRGPGARLYFAVQAGPTNLSKVRILWETFDDGWHHTDVYATNLVNGIAPIPLNVYSDGYQGGVLDYQLYYTDGTFSPVTLISFIFPMTKMIHFRISPAIS